VARLKLENFTKIYEKGHEPALNNLNLESKDGEFIALLGPSGCSKSSTLRMIAGLESVTSGQLLIGEQVMNNVAPKDRGVGLAFENYALYPPLSIYKNLSFNLQAKNMDRKTQKQKIERIAQLLGITDILNSKPGSLSGGQKQRVNIARALVREPTLLLLDEPLSHLDARARLQMRTELKRLHVEVGATTVLVTHDQLEAMALADRIAILDLGVLQQYGTPYEVYNYPANEFVAGFIGEPPMNIFAVELEQGASSTLRLPGTEFALPIGNELRTAVGERRKVKLGIRTHRIAVHRREAPGTVPGEIAVAEHLGDETRLLVRYGEMDLTVTLPITRSLKEGQPVYLEFDLAHTLLFDPETGVRIPVEAQTEGTIPATMTPKHAAEGRNITVQPSHTA